MSTTKLNYNRIVAVEATSRAIQHIHNNDSVFEMTLREAQVCFDDAGAIRSMRITGFKVNGRTWFGKKFRAHVSRITKNCTHVLVQPETECGEYVTAVQVVTDEHSGEFHEATSRIIETPIKF